MLNNGFGGTETFLLFLLLLVCVAPRSFNFFLSMVWNLCFLGFYYAAFLFFICLRSAILFLNFVFSAFLCAFLFWRIFLPFSFKISLLRFFNFILKEFSVQSENSRTDYADRLSVSQERNCRNIKWFCDKLRTTPGKHRLWIPVTSRFALTPTRKEFTLVKHDNCLSSRPNLLHV